MSSKDKNSEGPRNFGWWDGSAIRYRIATAYVGENGIRPRVQYRLNDHHQFVEVEAVNP